MLNAVSGDNRYHHTCTVRGILSEMRSADIERLSREAELLYSREEVNAAFDRMASEIERKLKHRSPTLICAMNGGVIATASLMARLEFPLRLDHVHATRYRLGSTGENVTWNTYPNTDLCDQTILVIDDILDEGITLAAIIDYCKQNGARHVFSSVLVNKIHDRKVGGIQPDFLGLEVEDRHIVGYGMDYKGYFRNAPGIFAIAGS